MSCPTLASSAARVAASSAARRAPLSDWLPRRPALTLGAGQPAAAASMGTSASSDSTVSTRSNADRCALAAARCALLVAPSGRPCVPAPASARVWKLPRKPDATRPPRPAPQARNGHVSHADMPNLLPASVRTRQQLQQRRHSLRRQHAHVAQLAGPLGVLALRAGPAQSRVRRALRGCTRCHAARRGTRPQVRLAILLEMQVLAEVARARLAQDGHIQRVSVEARLVRQPALVGHERDARLAAQRCRRAGDERARAGAGDVSGEGGSARSTCETVTHRSARHCCAGVPAPSARLGAPARLQLASRCTSSPASCASWHSVLPAPCAAGAAPPQRACAAGPRRRRRARALWMCRK
jgi:hypothetical protein